MKKCLFILIIMMTLPIIASAAAIGNKYYVDRIGISPYSRTSILTGTVFGQDNTDMVAGIAVDNNYVYIAYVRKDVSSYSVIIKSFGVGLFIGFLGWGLSRVGSMYSRMTR